MLERLSYLAAHPGLSVQICRIFSIEPVLKNKNIYIYIYKLVAGFTQLTPMQPLFLFLSNAVGPNGATHMLL